MKVKKLIKALLGISFLTLGMVTVNDVKEVNAAEEELATEDFESYTAGQTYNSTITYDKWKVYYGTVSTSSKITGDNSMAMRYYANSTTSYPYLEGLVDYPNVTKVTYKAKAATSNGAKLLLDTYYSTNSGSTWTKVDNAKTLTSSPVSYSFVVSETGEYSNVRIKFGVATTSTAPSTKNAQMTIDDIVVYGASNSTEPSLTISASGNYMDTNGELTFTPTIENADETTVTYTSSNNAVAAFEGNVLKAKSVGNVEVTASMVVNGETYTSKALNIKVWPEADSTLTIEEANGLSSLLASGEETPYSYSVVGTITEITNTTYGNATITDAEGNEYTIYGMYDENGNRYDSMTDKPVVNGTYNFEGKIKKHNNTIETVDSKVTKVTVAAGAYFTTQAQLGFTYEYSIKEEEVGGSYNVIPAELGLVNGAEVGTIASNDGVVQIITNKGSHTNGLAPKYYTSDGGTIRAYKGNTITFKADTMDSIQVTCQSDYVFSDQTVSGGDMSLTDTTLNITNITGSEVVLNVANSSRITSITVNYSGMSSSYEFTKFDNYQLRFFAEVQEVQVETLIKEGESIEDLTFGALITPKSYMENSNYASFEAAYAENPNVNFEEVFAAKNVTANYVDGQFGIILNNIPTTDVEVCVVLYAQATDGTMYFVEQKTVSVESVVTAYYNQINSLDLEEEQIEAVKALYAQVTAQA